MALYEFDCSACKLIFEVDAPMAEAPTEYDCPECEVECDRYWDANRLPGLKVAGTKHKVKVGHDDVKKVYEKSIEHSKEYLANPQNPYANFTKDLGEMVSDGEAQLRDPTKQKAKEDTYRHMTLDAHKRAGLDPTGQTPLKLDV